MAFSRSLVSAYADMPMIGMFQVRGSFLRVRTGSQRSMTGISRSIRITSGCSVTANLQPCSLSSAARTSKSPHRSRRVFSRAVRIHLTPSECRSPPSKGRRLTPEEELPGRDATSIIEHAAAAPIVPARRLGLCWLLRPFLSTANSIISRFQRLASVFEAKSLTSNPEPKS